ncbi:MAG: DUF5696 domain-containing protein [Verrucomicrobia bacterium]|nr:DUF5696 domain-containing protein [Verrucomicrobiota bacterium]
MSAPAAADTVTGKMNLTYPRGLRLCWIVLAGLTALAAPPTASSAEPAIANGGFESGLTGWRPLYTREPQTGQIVVDTQDPHSGKSAVKLTHTGEKDWSLDTAAPLPVAAGDLIELSAWVKIDGTGNVNLAVSTWGADRKVIAWSFGNRTTRAGADWQELRSRFVVPPGVVAIQPRLLGGGPLTAWIDDVVLVRKENVFARRPKNFPTELRMSNAALEVTLHTADGTLDVFDRRAQRRWTQRNLDHDTILKTATVVGDRLDLELFHAASGLDVTARIQLDADRPEFTVVLSAEGPLPARMVFPQPFAGEPGDYLVVPMNEGISYPVDDASIPPMSLIAYGGHGICMAFWGLTDGKKGQMAILETADDASIRMDRIEQKLAIAPVWEAQRGQFGYARRVRYAFFDQGGHVAMAKRYRAYAQQTGLFKTLEEKGRANPNVERLLGAVNVWCWDKDAVAIARELQAAGIQRILWSNRQGPEGIAAMNALGILTSRYDIYQDVMDPAKFPRLRYVHPDWTSAAWPKDIITDAAGRPTKGWGVEAKDGTMIDCGVICDLRATAYARERIPTELATHKYLGRFIDTTTAAPWHECYDPAHPMTRTQSRQAKMDLLRYVSEDNHLVTGCETGHDASVPYLHFFEGMMSLGSYRVPDSGRRMQEIWTEVPERVAKFQLGQAYRLPLWELVFHDCTVSYWYWGDYNNKLPALWDKRDLFNVLYGVPPMFMFDRKYWNANKARFVQSYQNTCPVVHDVATAEMTDHRFLTANRDVQETTYANGISVTVNFGATSHRLPTGETVAAMGYVVRGRR